MIAQLQQLQCYKVINQHVAQTVSRAQAVIRVLVGSKIKMRCNEVQALWLAMKCGHVM